MHDEVLADILRTPAMINLYPREADTVRRYVRVLREEGYAALEILARPPTAALTLFKELSAGPERHLLRLGLGTVKTRRDAEQAVSVKPDFLVSPAFSRRVLEVAVEADLPYIPGVCTLQDVQDVLDAFEDVGREVKVLKLCPMAVLNAEYVRILGAIYPGIMFCPTGTVTLEELPEWSGMPNIGPAMQSEYVPDELFETRDWDGVRRCLRTVRKRVQMGRAQA